MHAPRKHRAPAPRAPERAPGHLPSRTPVAAPAWAAAAGTGHDFGRVAVSRAPAAAGTGPIQCLLTADEFNGMVNQHAEAQQGEHLQAISGHLQDYHSMGDRPAAERAIKLSQLQTAIHRWHGATSRVGGLTGVAPIPNLDAIRQLSGEAETEHAERVHEARQVPDGPAPVDPSRLSEDDARAARDSWKSISAQRGNLRVQGSDAFEKRTFGQLAKLMEGDHGRKLVSSLDKRYWWGNKTVTIGNDFAEHPAFEGRPQSAGSYAHSTLTDKRHEVQQQGRRGFGDWVLSGLGVRSFPTVRTGDGMAAGVQGAITGGASGFFIHGEAGVQRFGAGSDALVRMAPPDGGAHLSPGEHDVPKPGFVTLGHELGHAQRITRGAALHGLGVPDERLGQLKAATTDQEDAQMLWSNPEEHVNITQVENPIRREHGVPERAFHKDSGGLRTYRDGRDRFEATRKLVGPRVNNLDERVRTMKGRLARLGGEHPDHERLSGTLNEIDAGNCELYGNTVLVDYRGGEFTDNHAQGRRDRMAELEGHADVLHNELNGLLPDEADADDAPPF